MIKILHKLALFWVKNANLFAEFFGENILKIITSVPGYWNIFYFFRKQASLGLALQVPEQSFVLRSGLILQQWA
jgi:hypothetical protein